MITQYTLKRYAPIIGDKPSGELIYNEIKDLLKTNDEVEIDFHEIVSMATFCAKQIFGNLYVELGSIKFFERIVIINCSEDVLRIIKEGISDKLRE